LGTKGCWPQLRHHYILPLPGLRSCCWDGYASANFTFTQDKLEDVFTIANQWIEAETRPVELMHYGIFAIKPSVDPKAVVVLLVFWQGTTIPTQYTDPLLNWKGSNIDAKESVYTWLLWFPNLDNNQDFQPPILRSTPSMH
jgi:hypothetical protein